LHEPVAPIVTFVGLRVGVNVHVPFFDQVFTPGEFVDTTADNFLASPAISDETFHVTFVDGAAATEPPTATAANTPTKNNSPAARRSLDLDVDKKLMVNLRSLRFPSTSTKKRV
jgi:hypothetical protein